MDGHEGRSRDRAGLRRHALRKLTCRHVHFLAAGQNQPASRSRGPPHDLKAPHRLMAILRARQMPLDGPSYGTVVLQEVIASQPGKGLSWGQRTN